MKPQKMLTTKFRHSLFITANRFAFRSSGTGIVNIIANSVHENKQSSSIWTPNMKVKEMLSRGRATRDSKTILNAICMAMTKDVYLEMKDYMAGFMAAAEIPESKKSELVFWMYNKLKSECNLPSIVYEKLFRVCSNRSHLGIALELAHDLAQKGLPFNDMILSELLVLIANNAKPGFYERDLVEYYQLYKSYSKSKSWLTVPTVYLKVSSSFVGLKNSSMALEVLRDMAEANHEPSAEGCAELLAAALKERDGGVLRVIANWYMNLFEQRMSQEQLDAMLETASEQADLHLAKMALQLMSKFEYVPTSIHYYHIVLACLQNDDVLSAMEWLQEMSANGVALGTEATMKVLDGSRVQPEQLSSEYENVRTAFVNRLMVTRTFEHIDTVYFALVDQVRNGRPVPRIVLDVVIDCYGKLRHKDRTMATFSEYEPVFRVKPNVGSFNSLLRGCAYSLTNEIQVLLAIFQDMEARSAAGDLSCKPNGESYSILLEAIVEAGEYAIFDSVLQLMKENNVHPTQRSLRRVAVAFAKQNNWEKVNEVMEFLKSVNKDVPVFLQTRLNEIFRTQHPQEKAPFDLAAYYREFKLKYDYEHRKATYLFHNSKNQKVGTLSLHSLGQLSFDALSDWKTPSAQKPRYSQLKQVRVPKPEVKPAIAAVPDSSVTEEERSSEVAVSQQINA